MDNPNKKIKAIKDLQSEKLKKKEGGKLDKCVLYTLKGAILNIPWWECKNLKG